MYTVLEKSAYCSRENIHHKHFPKRFLRVRAIELQDASTLLALDKQGVFLVSLLLTLNRFFTKCSGVSNVNFEQVNGV